MSRAWKCPKCKNISPCKYHYGELPMRICLRCNCEMEVITGGKDGRLYNTHNRE